MRQRRKETVIRRTEKIDCLRLVVTHMDWGGEEKDEYLKSRRRQEVEAESQMKQVSLEVFSPFVF